MASVFSVPIGYVAEHSGLGTWGLTLSTQDWALGALTSTVLNSSRVLESGEDLGDTQEWGSLESNVSLPI